MSMEIPKVQKAIIAENGGTPNYTVKVVDNYPVPEIGESDVLVRLTSSGVCHSDLSFLQGQWGMPMAAKVAGHEGSGYIVKVGNKVNPKYTIGLRVGVPLVADPCNNCEPCSMPDGETFCQNTPYYGSSIDGTWQQYVRVKSSYIIPVPDGPAETEVGPILCGGVTVYKALKETACRAGQWMVITGAGGGLGTMAIEYATSMGMRVIAIDSGSDKAKKCTDVGAEVFVDFKEDDVVKKIVEVTGGGAHGAVLIAPVVSSFNQSQNYLRTKGSIAVVGLPNAGDTFDIIPANLIFKGLSIKGSLVGGKYDLGEALEFVARGKVHPPIRVYEMDQIADILAMMEKGTLCGRAVINLQ